MEDRKLAEIVDLAIQRETEAHDFYLGLVARVRDAGTKDTLVWLAKEEKRHREFLESYKAGKLQPGAPPDVGGTGGFAPGMGGGMGRGMGGGRGCGRGRGMGRGGGRGMGGGMGRGRGMMPPA